MDALISRFWKSPKNLLPTLRSTLPRVLISSALVWTACAGSTGTYEYCQNGVYNGDLCVECIVHEHPAEETPNRAVREKDL